jgi:RNA polymerase sigma-70 factor (ECF subfamily)
MIECAEEDRILVLAISKGDQKAFQKLFEKYHERLYFSAVKILKSPDLSKEVVQDVFLKIWNYREKLNADLSFAAFLFKVSNNLILNILKRASLENSIKKQILYHAPKSFNSTEDVIMSQEYERILSEAVTHLPPQRKLVFELCKNEGKTYEEVAITLGISKGTVKDHIVKASRAIKNYVSINGEMILPILILIGLKGD